MEDCIFCKIVSGEIPKDFVYENDFAVAFPDIKPEAPGHILLIPKEHHEWFYDVPSEISNEWFRAAQTLAKKIKEEHNCMYVELKIAGIHIPHTHIHLIPRN